jgi:hypothetical protein
MSSRFAWAQTMQRAGWTRPCSRSGQLTSKVAACSAGLRTCIALADIWQRMTSGRQRQALFQAGRPGEIVGYLNHHDHGSRQDVQNLPDRRESPWSPGSCEQLTWKNVRVKAPAVQTTQRMQCKTNLAKPAEMHSLPGAGLCARRGDSQAGIALNAVCCSAYRWQPPLERIWNRCFLRARSLHGWPADLMDVDLAHVTDRFWHHL